MLGSKTEISLLLILIIPTLIVPVFAEDDSLILVTDKAEYEIDDSMVISGFVDDKKMPVVALKIFDPSGGILSANQVDIQDDNTFSKTIELISPFYDEIIKKILPSNVKEIDTSICYERFQLFLK